MIRTASTLVHALLAMHAPGPSEPPDDPTALAPIIQQAEADFLADRYRDAARGFAEAYAASPDPKFLYAQAQAERLAGDCPAARRTYEDFLATNPATAAADEARTNSARCTDGLSVPAVRKLQEPPGQPPRAAATAPVGDLAPTRPTRRPWHRDPLGGALVGIGLAATAAGATSLGIGLSTDRGATRAATEDEFLATKREARTAQRVGIGLVVSGSMLVVAGAVRWAVLGTQAAKPPRAANVEFGYGPSGPTLAWHARF